MPEFHKQVKNALEGNRNLDAVGDYLTGSAEIAMRSLSSSLDISALSPIMVVALANSLEAANDKNGILLPLHNVLLTYLCDSRKIYDLSQKNKATKNALYRAINNVMIGCIKFRYYAVLRSAPKPLNEYLQFGNESLVGDQLTSHIDNLNVEIRNRKASTRSEENDFQKEREDPFSQFIEQQLNHGLLKENDLQGGVVNMFNNRYTVKVSNVDPNADARDEAERSGMSSHLGYHVMRHVNQANAMSAKSTSGSSLRQTLVEKGSSLGKP